MSSKEVPRAGRASPARRLAPLASHCALPAPGGSAWLRHDPRPHLPAVWPAAGTVRGPPQRLRAQRYPLDARRGTPGPRPRQHRAPGARWVQIPRGLRGRSYAGCRVEVRERLDGHLRVLYHDTLLASQPSPDPAFVLRPRQGPGQSRVPARAIQSPLTPAESRRGRARWAPARCVANRYRPNRRRRRHPPARRVRRSTGPGRSPRHRRA